MWCFRVFLSGVWPARDWKQKPFDRSAGNAKGSLWQRGSGFAFFEVAADLASVIIWPTMPGK